MAYRSSAIQDGIAGNITATPAGTVAGDYLCGVMVCDSQTPGITVPTGWTSRATVTNTGPDGQTMVYADKIAVGGDSFTWNNTSGNAVVVNAAFSGRSSTNPRSALVTDVNNTSNSGASPITVTSSGVTAINQDDVAVFMQMDETVGADTWVFSALTNYTKRQDQNASSVNFVRGIALFTRDNVSAGATGSLSSNATRTGSGNAGWSTVAVSIAVPSVDHPITIGSGSFSQQGQSVILRPGSTTYLRYRR